MIRENAKPELWRDRLTTPAYRVVEAARYAKTSTQTICNWERLSGGNASFLSTRGHGSALSFLQLIEVGVVAAMRKSGVSLRKIKLAREYLVSEFDSRYPFAEHRFKTDGKQLFVDYTDVIGEAAKAKLLSVTEGGQLAWADILADLLKEFGYAGEATVMTWKVAGVGSPVLIDPRVSFGAPQVHGVPTWVLRERYVGGESLEDIADDFDIDADDVSAALRFENVDFNQGRTRLWTN